MECQHGSGQVAETRDDPISNSPSNVDPIAPPRFPRWTRQEIVVLIEGKRVEESRGRKYRVFDGGPANTESKWSSISSYCKRHGVNREPVQCRKRWSTLSRDYKRIREWERSNKDQSFWLLRNDLRRESKLPGFFDRELYDIIERAFSCGRQQGGCSSFVKEDETDPNAGRGTTEEGLFSDAELSEAQEDVPESPGKEITGSPSATPPPGMSSEKPLPPNSEKDSAPKSTGLKRTHASDDEENGFKVRRRILSILERNGRVLAAHIESHNLNCEMDRNQRSEQAQKLVGVLGKLAEALSKIADKLP
ncbi:hypothetical protein AMTRI_Chr01g137540 [Amborella trichopoda]|uniref:Myb-like domain-containing protein n=1 Tax=Amborella trichopoda TaxID=13333 RepID=W1PWZ0_AMBTC|nr:trihelix transcription factor ASR3 [Amborella trichopoda]ERN12336.1 hypothetical protein AMTR_s00025p00072580 [Amborella trichopoda]|eukprot:XP_006850755.1 trihelix transcription factor ASR3 [Amborella trichopoda]